MIVVDTSALMAIINNEPMALACIAALENATILVISASTMSEALIVATGRGILPKMEDLFERMDFEIVPVDAATAKQMGKIYSSWGKGIHPAGLNFGDCFAYALAKDRNCPLLFVGNDFSQTDVVSAI
ncbi:type II toxin-antitoxin system VapC family toxin [Devosia lacusdianchii]|uniref:type II toxin-antitoxin system VapC family toxin n=1 Tax=Devosia lacusdianchii TaxID=2917991 RepID=UPI001F0638E0|nr:type II toxin-antitoxin system VapC family toxin [Devosia sp. JXJ CY 41]